MLNGFNGRAWRLQALSHASFDDSNDTKLLTATPTATTATSTTEMERLTIATDGSRWSDDAAGCAFAFQWYDGQGHLGIVGFLRAIAPVPSAEIAELAGIELAFEHLFWDLEHGNVRSEVTHIDFVSDCLNAVNKINAVQSGISEYEGTRVGGVVEMAEQVLEEYGIVVSFRWLRRNTLPEQQEADAWANEASSLSWDNELVEEQTITRRKRS